MYILERFGSTLLPIGAPRHTAGTAPSQQRMLKTLGGAVYDADGTTRSAAELPYELTYDCKAVGSTATEIRTILDGLRALRGVEARLYRKALDDDSRQWATARLSYIQYDTEARHSHGRFQPLSMVFLVKTLWRGIAHCAPWYLDTGKYLDAGLYLDMYDRYPLTTTSTAIVLTNGGPVYTDDVVLTLEAGATPVTNLAIVMGSCHLVWSGTVAANKSLVIDCSPLRRSVLNDGLGAWNYLDLGANHASEAWMRMESGSNSMIVSRTGGGSDTYLTVEFNDQWE